MLQDYLHRKPKAPASYHEVNAKLLRIGIQNEYEAMKKKEG